MSDENGDLWPAEHGERVSIVPDSELAKRNRYADCIKDIGRRALEWTVRGNQQRGLRVLERQREHSVQILVGDTATQVMHKTLEGKWLKDEVRQHGLCGEE